MKLWKCDKCKRMKEIEMGNYPKDWFLIKVYSKPQSKSGTAKGFHLCKKCKESVFGK